MPPTSAVIKAVDAGGIDVLILDGEAVPSGGMGICRQLKDEIYNCPPILVITGRRDDAWLASWSRADAAVPHPINGIALAPAVAELMRQRLGARAGSLSFEMTSASGGHTGRSTRSSRPGRTC